MKSPGIQVNRNKILFYMVTQHLRVIHYHAKRKCRVVLPGQIILGDSKGNVLLTIADVVATAEDMVEVHYHINGVCYNDNFYIQPVYVGLHIHLFHLN